MKQLILAQLLSICFIFQAHAQYLGGANSSGFTVTASDEYQDSRWGQPASAINSINESGMNSAYFDAFRFLTQASIAFDSSDIADVMSDGYETWIDNQFNLPMNSMLDETESVKSWLENHYNETWARPDWTEFNYAWWQLNMTNADLQKEVLLNGCCGEKEFLKLYSLTLTQHPVVVGSIELWLAGILPGQVW